MVSVLVFSGLRISPTQKDRGVSLLEGIVISDCLEFQRSVRLVVDEWEESSYTP